MTTSTKYYCIASRSNMLRPAADRIRFATSYSADYGWEWDCAERAEYYALDEIGKMLESIDAARGSNYVGNGEASPDDLYIVPADIAQKIAARNADMSLYDWEEYEGPEDDDEAQGAWCEAQDVEECERAALDWDGVLSEEFGDGRAPDADERAKLEEAGYSASDAADARVLARDSVGSVLFRIPGTMDYAVEGGSGDVVAELDAHDAFREWFGKGRPEWPTTTTRESARHVCATPCYIDDNNSVPSNPYRLTVYVDGNGEIMLAAEGNGCADDIMLADITGESADSIREAWGDIDTDALRDNAAELRAAGLADEADYLLAWADRKDEADA